MFEYLVLGWGYPLRWDVLCSAAVMKHYGQKQRKEGVILACHPTGLDVYNGGGRDGGRGRKLRSHLSHTQVLETRGGSGARLSTLKVNCQWYTFASKALPAKGSIASLNSSHTVEISRV